MSENTDADPYEEGFEAALEGFDESMNPYEVDTEECDEWYNGFDQGIFEKGE